MAKGKAPVFRRQQGCHGSGAPENAVASPGTKALSSSDDPVPPVESPLILAVDLGTQSLRLSALDRDGRTHWRWARPVASFIDGARNEQDPAEWASLLDEALIEAGQAGLRPAAIAAAGPLAGWVPLAAGRPIGRATMYFDTRAADEVAAVDAVIAGRPDLPRPTVADPLPQLLRLRREEPEQVATMDRLLDATGFLVHRLCGASILDPYTALRLYDPDVQAALGLDATLFGRPTAVGAVAGHLSAPLAAHFGGGSIPVIAATFDSKCAYLASGLAPGEALDISGTVTSFGVASTAPVRDAAKRVYAVPMGADWLVRGSMGGTGSVLEWARAALIGTDFAVIEADVARVPPGAEGVTFLPFHSGARAPLWMPKARGALLGLGLDTGRPAMARAIYEGLCFGLRHIAEAMAENGVVLKDIRLAGGLARSDLLCQMKADILGCPALRLSDHELTSAGLAVIATTALGFHADRVSASRAIVRVADRFTPGPQSADYAAPYARYRAAVEALAPTFGP